MRVAIVGAGPSGSALAILLARQGARVTLFDDGRRPELLVGESLVPAVIPILQRLGLEEETASFSRVKPGVSFIWSPTDRFSFSFARFAPGVFPYAYNIPRPRFDDAVLARAVACGVERVVAHARLEPVSEGGRELGHGTPAIVIHRVCSQHGVDCARTSPNGEAARPGRGELPAGP